MLFPGSLPSIRKGTGLKLNRKKDYFKKNYLYKWQLYLLLLPSLAYIIIFAYIPLAGIQIAFKKYDMALGIWGSPWVGFDQFKRFLTSYKFVTILKNTLVLSFYSLLAGFPLPIILALLLNAFPGKKYKKLVQTVSYMPHFISTVVIVGMLMQLLNPRVGAFGVLYQHLTGELLPNIMAKPAAFKHLYVWSGIWQGLGWSSIIYIAALSGVDEELHEAAMVDGASRFQRVLHIDFPAILPTVTIMLILNAGSIMGVGFEKAYLMQNTLNLSSSEIISTYVYKIGLVVGTGDFSYSTAIGLFNSIINFLLLVTVNSISRKVSDSSLF